MLLGGLWHGANWTFVVWGGLHGLYLTIHRNWRTFFNQENQTAKSSAFMPMASWLFTFLAVVAGWVLFRSPDIDTASVILKGMVGLNGVAIPNGIAVRLGGFGAWLNSLGVDFYLGGGAIFIKNYLWVILLSFIAFTLPNTQEIMALHESIIDPYKERSSGIFAAERFFMRRCWWDLNNRWAFVTAVFAALGILSLNKVSEFLYFQF